MIIIEMTGGLGNQLQQYALYEKFISLGKDVRLDISWYRSDDKIRTEEASKAKDTTIRNVSAGSTKREPTAAGSVTKRDLELDYFPGVSYQVCTPQEKQEILGSSSLFSKAMRKLGFADSGRYSEYRMYDEDIFQMENKVLSGYWACEAYYAGIMETLREKLAFPPSENPLNEELKNQMAERNSVSIHLRRGDYLTGENQRMFGGICTDEYYRAAVRYIRERVENPHFYVFSDEPEYAGKFFSGLLDFTIVDINQGKDSFYDIELMSQCKHNICANSTFSFWGARLNSHGDRIAIRPLKQKNGVDWYQPEEMKRLWRGWICIDEQGRKCT